MALAHAIHRMTWDADFVSQFKSDAEAVLARFGLDLTKEEVLVLTTTLKEETIGENVSFGAKTAAVGWWWI